MEFQLPSTAYSSPPRQAGGTQLNTIIEENRSIYSSGNSGSDTDRTITAMPVALQRKLGRLPEGSPTRAPSSRPDSVTSDDSVMDLPMQRARPPDFDDLYDATDDETDFSDSNQSVPSSRPTSFATDSTRFSHASNGSRKRFPSLLIPTNNWPLQDAAQKFSPVPPTPPPKIPVSPAMLSLLPQQILAINATPSLDGSMTSDQISNIGTPQTPETRSIGEGEGWGPRTAFRLPPEPGDNQLDFDQTVEPEIEIQIQGPEQHGGWDHILSGFPQAPQFALQQIPRPLPVIEEASCETSRKTTPEAKIASPPRMPSSFGIELPEDALATLQNLGLDPESDLQSEATEAEVDEPSLEMAQLDERKNTPEPKFLEAATPASELSKYSFTDLSIPSPGGFFSSLKAGARHTWGYNRDLPPPTSTTAENFYNVPWLDSGTIVEQIREMDENLTDGPPTARLPKDVPVIRPPRQRRQSTTGSIVTVEEIRGKTPPVEYDVSYAKQVQNTASVNLDRTSIWLAAQESYLSALRESNPVNELPATPEQEPNPIERKPSKHEKKVSGDSQIQKAVRFIEGVEQSKPEDAESKTADKQSSVHYRGFQVLQGRAKRRDSFTHSIPRFDAVQAQRIGLMDNHINHLLGKFDLDAPQRPAYTGPFSRMSRQMSKTDEQAMFARIGEEQRALKQLSVSMWVIEALKYLNGGRLLPSPAGIKLAKATTPLDQPSNSGKSRHRVLDLGGQPACDWAWHCANEYRNVKTYTVVTKGQLVNDDLKGPPNHRRVSVPHLWKLPFPDHYFDLISARSLHAHLQNQNPLGESSDEYDLCLKECFRCLKPGGYLEFLLLDSEIAHAGPLGSAMSVELDFNLKTRGYDPAPTKPFLARLRKAKFISMKRAWVYLPVGSPVRDCAIPREAPHPSPPDPVDSNYEAVLGPIGSTEDIASISGLLGGWLWEQWMLKLHMEMGKEKEKLLEGVSSVIEEGRGTGAGWRALSGWARKPKRARISEIVNHYLDDGGTQLRSADGGKIVAPREGAVKAENVF